MASDKVTEPAFLPSSEVTCTSMSRTSCVLADSDRCGGLIIRELELAGLRHAVRQLSLHRVPHRDPAAFDAGHGAFDQDQATRDVGLADLEIERCHPIDAEMSRHLLVLERPSGILAAAGRAYRAVRDRHAMARPQATEIPALHAAGPAFAGRCAGDVDILPDDKMICGDLRADRNERIVINAEFGQLALRLDLGDGKMAAIGLGRALHLARAGAELQRDVAVLFLGAVADDLA